VVVVSAAANVVHTASHAGQHVIFLPLWHLVFIAVVIYAAPVVAAVLLWTRYRVTGVAAAGDRVLNRLVGDAEALASADRYRPEAPRRRAGSRRHPGADPR
jgi:hypothetical protein